VISRRLSVAIALRVSVVCMNRPKGPCVIYVKSVLHMPITIHGMSRKYVMSIVDLWFCAITYNDASHDSYPQGICRSERSYATLKQHPDWLCMHHHMCISTYCMLMPVTSCSIIQNQSERRTLRKAVRSSITLTSSRIPRTSSSSLLSHHHPCPSHCSPSSRPRASVKKRCHQLEGRL
jgi:hypothetical protein